MKGIYKNKPIIVTIEEEFDTTEYLLSNPANKKHLEESILQARKGELIEVHIE